MSAPCACCGLASEHMILGVVPACMACARGECPRCPEEETGCPDPVPAPCGARAWAWECERPAGHSGAHLGLVNGTWSSW